MVRLFIVNILMLALPITFAFAEPWIDTRDAWLRADIEMLADIGIISVPITTYPLIWSGIIKDIDNTSIENVPQNYKDSFWRVKKAGGLALTRNSRKELRLSMASSSQVLRGFGDEQREKREISARKVGLSDSLAWNLEITRNTDPLDGERIRYDGSYVAFVWRNWIASFGTVEKWWGSGWDSASLLSNNARPELGMSLQRNYSNKADSSFFKWIGVWTFNSFVVQLDDERFINKVKFTGLSFTFKPHQSLEIGLRTTALWGGRERKGLVGDITNNANTNEHCVQSNDTETTEFECSEFEGDRSAGFDIRWRLPFEYPISIYTSFYDEKKTEQYPSKNKVQYGITFASDFLASNLKWYAEVSVIDSASVLEQAYESVSYQGRYRHYKKGIGSAYSDEYNSFSLGILGTLNKRNKFDLSLSDIELNRSKKNQPDLADRSIKDFQRIKLDWSYRTEKIGDVMISVEYSSELYDDLDINDDQVRVALSWTYKLK